MRKNILANFSAIAISTIIAIGPIFLPLGASASEGSISHGGDIECEAAIQTIVADLTTWISSGGPEAGPLILASTQDPAHPGSPLSLDEYKSGMLAVLGQTLTASCVSASDGAAVYPVTVAGAEKICVSQLEVDGLHLTCARALFLGLSTDLRYEQIHHEFATNVNGLEPDSGPVSSYKISVQLAGALKPSVAKQLVVGSFSGAPSGSNTRTTVSGSIFTRVTNHPELGAEQWKDPDGVTWGERTVTPDEPFLEFAQAIALCNSVGARLPTADEYYHLREFLGWGSDVGYVPEILPELYFITSDEGNEFWSSTPNPNGEVMAFGSKNGWIGPEGRHVGLSVRCVAR